MINLLLRLLRQLLHASVLIYCLIIQSTSLTNNDSNFLYGSGILVLRQGYHLILHVPSHLNTYRLIWFVKASECSHTIPQDNRHSSSQNLRRQARLSLENRRQDPLKDCLQSIISRNIKANQHTHKDNIRSQCAKKVMSDSPGLVNFAIGLVIFVLNLPDGQVLLLGEIEITDQEGL